MIQSVYNFFKDPDTIITNPANPVKKQNDLCSKPIPTHNLIATIFCKDCQGEINSTCYCAFGHTFCTQTCLKSFLLKQIYTEKDPIRKLDLESLLDLVIKT